MADKIQIRRDTAATWTAVNPTLSQGEMGFETDTGKIKVGDGATAWTGLGYITDAAADPTTVDTFVMLGNYDGSAWSHYISSAMSYDGLNWSGINNHQGKFPYIADMQNNGMFLGTWNVEHVAAGNGKVVYVYNSYDGGTYTSFLLNAPHPDVMPQFIEGTAYNTDENPAYFYVWETVFFQGGYFVAVGSMWDNANGVFVPAFKYSADGETWLNGNIDLEWAMAGLWNGGTAAPGSGGVLIADITYNGTGWFFTFGWNYFGGGPTDPSATLGGCYVTILSTELNSGNYSNEWSTGVTFYGGSVRYTAYNGKTWIACIGDTNSIYLNANVDPTQGMWSARDYWTESANNVINITAFDPNWPPVIDSVDGGLIGEDNVLAISNDYGHVHISTDQGRTWTLTIPDPAKTMVATIADDGEGNIYLTISDDPSRKYNFGDYQPGGGPVTITGATGETALNDNWVLADYDGGIGGWPLYQSDGITRVTTGDLNVGAYTGGSATLTSDAYGAWTSDNPEHMFYAEGALYYGNSNGRIFRWAGSNWTQVVDLDKAPNAYYSCYAFCYGTVTKNTTELINVYDGRLNRSVTLGDKTIVDYNGSGPQYIGAIASSDEIGNEITDAAFYDNSPSFIFDTTIWLGWTHMGRNLIVDITGLSSTIMIPPHDLIALPTGYTVYISVVGTGNAVYVEEYTSMSTNYNVYTEPVMTIPSTSFFPAFAGINGPGNYTLTKIHDHQWSLTGPSDYIFANL